MLVISAIATGHLLVGVVYPEQEDQQPESERTVHYAYNAQGQRVWMRDQEGNVVETDYDDAGREVHRRVTTLASGFDGLVERISTTYLGRGLVDKVTQYDDEDPGQGSVVDDVRYVYDGWGNLVEFLQDVDSELGGTPSGRHAFQVGYTYAQSGSSGPNTRSALRRTHAALPGSTTVLMSYLSSGGRLDDAASRVSRLSVSDGQGFPPIFLIAAEYEYLGVGRVVGTDLLEPKARWRMFEGATGGNPYPDLDRFNRVTSSRWTGYKGTGTRDFYHVDLTYDAASNIVSAVDHVHRTGLAGAGDGLFDVGYELDELHRLERAVEGNWTGSAINNVTRDERWQDSSGDLALSQTGNWLRRRLDLTGNGQFTGAGELDETSTFNNANELLTRDIDSDSTVDYELEYDLVGNLVDDGRDYKYVYDPFGRLRKVLNRDTDNLVAEYRYNGLGFRIGWHSDVTDEHGEEPDGVVDQHDPWFWFCYDESWRIVAVFRDDDEDPKEVFVHHNAGVGGC